MEIWILGSRFETIGIVDNYESFIWSDRYNQAGDFELYILADKSYFDILKRGNYLYIHDSNKIQVIETISIDTDVEEGDHITVTGRSLESMLERRIVMQPGIISGKFDTALLTVLRNNIRGLFDNPVVSFNIKDCTDATIKATDYETAEDAYGKSLYDILVAACQEKQFGFEITFDEDGNNLEFQLYNGVDRSWAQTDRVPVVFSSEYDNLIGSSYYENDKNVKTTVLVIGDQEETDNATYASEKVISDIKRYIGTDLVCPYFKTRGEYYIANVDIASGAGTGMNRREISTTGPSFDGGQIEVPEFKISWYLNESGDGIDPHSTFQEDFDEFKQAIEDRLTQIAEYETSLRKAGEEFLVDYKLEKTFNGEIEPEVQFTYGKDFRLGDIVQVCDRYDRQARSRVSEITISMDQDQNGMFPTFELVDTPEDDVD